jgi:O-antigen/teichoic acid export membrane protein
LKQIFTLIKNLSGFGEGHERTNRAKKNIAASLIIKGLSILISLLLVPLTLNYVDANNYGIWLTISSIVIWVTYLDIGLNNGLRNKFAEAKATGNLEFAQRYVSTTYALLSMIFISLIIVFSIVNNYLNWSSIFRLPESMAKDLSLIMLIVVTYFCLKFILSTINIILIADQRPAEASLRSLIEQITSLIIIFVLTKTTEGSLLNLCLGLCISPLIVVTFFNITLFKGRYKYFMPKYSKIDMSLSKGLFSMGFKFFIVQIAMIIQFNTSNIIIIRSFGAGEVTSYNIAYRYFDTLSMLLLIIVAPFWSSVTEAYANGDFDWIINTTKKYKKIIVWFFILGIIMLALSPFIYKLWLGNNEIKIPFLLSFWVLLFVFSKIYGIAYGTVLNGIGALKIQFYSAIISPFIFLGLCYLMINVFHWGIISILISAVIANYNGYILAPLQYKKVFIDNKKGMWLR